MRSPKDFFKPLAIGAPQPLTEIPVRPSRMIHFFDPGNERMRARVPEMAQQVDVLLGNLEDAVAADRKVDARNGLVEVTSMSLGASPCLCCAASSVSHAPTLRGSRRTDFHAARTAAAASPLALGKRLPARALCAYFLACAAMPLAKATAPQPPSRLATRSSNTATVGFMMRE